jgi:hypothetical protein
MSVATNELYNEIDRQNPPARIHPAWPGQGNRGRPRRHGSLRADVGSADAKVSTSEIGATEAVHRALALRSLGKLGNDRVYAKFAQREDVAGLPTSNQPGFYNIMDAVSTLEAAGFGFGKPGQAYNYADVAARTPTDPDVNTISVS